MGSEYPGVRVSVGGVMGRKKIFCELLDKPTAATYACFDAGRWVPQKTRM
jgi:hypothetical protein